MGIRGQQELIIPCAIVLILAVAHQPRFKAAILQDIVLRDQSAIQKKERKQRTHQKLLHKTSNRPVVTSTLAKKYSPRGVEV